MLLVLSLEMEMVQGADSYMINVSVMALGQTVTNLTSSITTKATILSKIMDTTNGGTEVYGGFHRIFGGHNVWDLDMWSSYGLDYPKELLKDVITPNGLPLPGTKELIEKLGVSYQTAQDWGCVNIGDLIGGSISVIDSGLKIKRFVQNETSEEVESGEVVSLLLKLTIATTTTNPIMLSTCLIDAGILAKRTYDNTFDGMFEFDPILTID